MKNQALLFFLLFSFAFTANAQLRLYVGGVGGVGESVIPLPTAGGGTYNIPIPLSANSRLVTLDDKEYTISGRISGAFDLTVELFANSSKVTFSGEAAYTGSTTVTRGELILTNASTFKSPTLTVVTGATLTIDASAYGSTNSAAPYSVFGTNFTSHFTVLGTGQVNFKGVRDKYYTVTGAGTPLLPAKSMKLQMSSGGQLNIVDGNWNIGASGMDISANNFGNLNVAANTKFIIYGTAAQFNKLTGEGQISNSSPGADLTIKIGWGGGTADGTADGTCDWGGTFSTVPSVGVARKINIEKVGLGTIAFTGNSHPSGTITITRGALSINDGEHTGNIVNNSELILNRLGRSNFKYQISGSGRITKKEDGEVTLTGGNTGIVSHFGTTTVERGSLVLRCKEIKNSNLIIVQGGATLVTTPHNSTNSGEVSTGGLSLVSDAAVHFKFTKGAVPFTRLAVSGISAPDGFRVRFSGEADSFNGDDITLIRCSGALPVTLPKIVENSIDPGAGTRSGIRKCITLRWQNGIGLLATIAATGPTINLVSPEICLGDTRTFSISSLPGTPAVPAWTSLNPNIVSITSAGLATGERMGESVVIYTNLAGCVVTSTIKVNGHTIRPENPQASFCPGDVITLKAYDTPTSGTNSTYNPAWTSEHPLIATVAGDATVPGKPEARVTLLTSGPTTIKFKDSKGCFAKFEVTVKVPPTLRYPHAAICRGSSLYLEGGPGFATNAWRSSNTLKVTVNNNGWASGVAVGDATITFRGLNGCTATSLVSVRNLGTIANAGENKEICGGTNVTLGAPAINGVIYSWNPVAGLSAANVANPVATPTVGSTTYTVTAGFSNPTQCPSNTDEVRVDVNPLPVLTSAQGTGTSSQVQLQTAVNLTATTNGTATSWVSSDIGKVTVAAGTDFKTATAIGAAVGNANITYTDEKGCAATHAITVYNRTPQNLTFEPIPTKTMRDPDFSLVATTTSGLPLRFRTTSDKVIITGDRVKIEKAGLVEIQVYQEGNETYNSASLSNSFCINPSKPVITGNRNTLTSSEDNGNQWYLNTTLIETGATGKTYLATVVDGSYTVRATIDGCTGVASEAIVPSKGTQTINFPLIADKTLGDPDFTLLASADSELPVAYTTTSDKVIITGDKVKIVKVGKVTIVATQVGNQFYNPAPPTSQTFCIKPAKPTISMNNRILTSSVAADNGNQWYLNQTAIERATGKTHFAAVDGNYAVKVTLEECTSDFSDPISVSSSDKADQTITFTAIPDKTEGEPDFSLAATTTSNLPITFSTTSDKVTIIENSAKIMKAGRASIHANQAGNNIYKPATQTNTFCINPAKPTISASNKTLTSSAEEGNQWYLNTELLIGSTGKTHNAVLDGNYTVKVTVEECASAVSDVALITVTGDISGEELKIFPNPVHDQLVIELPSHENGLISLFSVAGQNLYSTAASGKAIISMKDFPAGIYILKIQTAGKMRVKKVVRK